MSKTGDIMLRKIDQKQNNVTRFLLHMETKKKNVLRRSESEETLLGKEKKTERKEGKKGQKGSKKNEMCIVNMSE